MKVYSWDDIKAGLFIRGEKAPVRLNFDRTGACYFEPKFVKECIEEMRQLEIRGLLGEPPTALERLAVILIVESAGIEIRAKVESGK